MPQSIGEQHELAVSLGLESSDGLLMLGNGVARSTSGFNLCHSDCFA